MSTDPFAPHADKQKKTTRKGDTHAALGKGTASKQTN